LVYKSFSRFCSFLQRPKPQQGAAAAADASARAAAQHLPHSALPPEREGHAAPGRVRARRMMTGQCEMVVKVLCKHVHTNRHTSSMCVIPGLCQGAHHHPACSLFNFQQAQNHNSGPKVTLQTTGDIPFKIKKKKRVTSSWTVISFNMFKQVVTSLKPSIQTEDKTSY